MSFQTCRPLFLLEFKIRFFFFCVITISRKFNSITRLLDLFTNQFDCFFSTQEYLTVINQLRYSSDISTDLCIFISIHSQKKSARIVPLVQLYTLECLLMLLILIYNVIFCTANILNTIILSMDLILYFKLWKRKKLCAIGFQHFFKVIFSITSPEDLQFSTRVTLVLL